MLVMEIFTVPVSAQSDTPVVYEVISGQAINARACARLDCAVVMVFEPGTVLTSTGTRRGDTVAGSDGWIQVEIQGQTVYVHESLVEEHEAEDAAVEPAETGPARDLHLNTVRWTDYETPGLNFRGPSGWATCEELDADDEYWDTYEDSYGKVAVIRQREFIEDCLQWLDDGQYDQVILDPFDDGGIFVFRRYYPNVSLTTRYLQHDIVSYASDELGQDIEVSEVLDLPGGDALRLIISEGSGRERVIFMSYSLTDNEYAYTAELVAYANDQEYYQPYIDALAETMRMVDNGK